MTVMHTKIPTYQHEGPILHLPPLPKGDNYAFHTMLKPSGAQCNIDCDYCFYLHKQDLLQQVKHPRMLDSVLEAHIRQYIEAQTVSEVVFTWQGGEPTLMGIDFFEKVIALQRRYAKPNQVILNDIQTNGLLLDDAWCQFLKHHNFLVGISIDGPKHLHDTYRRTKNDKPTFELVMQAIERLHRYDIPFHALCVVNRENAQYPLEVYDFLKTQVRPRMIQLLAGVEPKQFDTVAPLYWKKSQVVPASAVFAQAQSLQDYVTDWSVLPDAWGKFLATIWQYWLAHDYGRVFIDQFENTISQLLGYGAQKCTTSPICGKALALEHNGDLYCCDHFVYPEYKLGNILQTHEGDLAFSQKQQQFAYLKHTTLPKYCQSCDYLTMCWGECPKGRLLTTPDGEKGLNYLCRGLKIYYQQVTQDLPILTAKITAKSNNNPA